MRNRRAWAKWAEERENPIVTLVVARVTPLGVRLAADMRITYSSRNSSFLNAALKLVLLSPTLCVGYAGDVDTALEAIRIARREQMRNDEAIQHLLAAHLASGQAAQFLVASLRPTRLTTIKDGVQVDATAGWIGEVGPFAEYQRHYLADESFRPPDDFYANDGRLVRAAAACARLSLLRLLNPRLYLLRDGRRCRCAPLPAGHF
jgi:uncharacterized protein YoaH (UPF0181 family)